MKFLLDQNLSYRLLGLLQSHPPKIVWIKSGNTSTAFLASVLQKNFQAIEEFSKNKEVSCLELYY